ncbi:13932_t:CDS:2, partial [Acaulospora morrowiae]
SLEIEPDDAFALRNRGVTYAMLGKYKDSLSDLNRSLELEPNNLFASKHKEEVHRISDEYDKSISDRNVLSKKQNIIHGRFSSEEDEKLLEYINKHGVGKWQDVAGHVGTRSEKQCRERYYGHLAPGVNKLPFTENEIKKIRELREEGYKWAEISRRLGNGLETTFDAQSFFSFSGRALYYPSVFLNDERLTNELPSMQLLPGLPTYHSPLKPLEGINNNKQLNIQLPPITSYMQIFKQ